MEFVIIREAIKYQLQSLKSTCPASGDLQIYGSILTIFEREMAYFRGTICSMFYSHTFIGGWFIFSKVQNSYKDLLLINQFVWLLYAKVVQNRRFRQMNDSGFSERKGRVNNFNSIKNLGTSSRVYRQTDGETYAHG